MNWPFIGLTSCREPLMMKRSLLAAMVLATTILVGARVHGEQSKTPPASSKSALDRFQSIIDSLGLGDDQKLKAGILFDGARREMKKLDAKADPTAIKEQTKAIYDKLRADIGEILTNKQKLEVIRKMLPPGPGQIIARIKQSLQELPATKITDDQKKKAFDILDEAGKKLEEIRDDATDGGKDIPARMNAVLKDMGEKLKKVLAPDESGGKPK